jgi:hypothetical protein
LISERVCGLLVTAWTWLEVKWALLRGRRGSHQFVPSNGETGDGTTAAPTPAAAGPSTATPSPQITVFSSAVLEGTADPVTAAKQRWDDVSLGKK